LPAAADSLDVVVLHDIMDVVSRGALCLGAVRLSCLGLVAAVLAIAGCGDNAYRTFPYFDWDDAADIGAFHIDKLSPPDAGLSVAVQRAVDENMVVLFYGHDPPVKTSYETIEALLTLADERGIPMLTFADLARGGDPRPGICLSFDDDDVDAWFALRDRLAAHHAHVSFMVTGYAAMTQDQRDKLHVLYEDGHSMEAHGVHHLGALAYLATHSMQEYLDQEIQPSIDVLRADGFAPVAYAHPGGARTAELDEEVAKRIRFVRSTSGAPR
jgi:hypothetical protein